MVYGFGFRVSGSGFHGSGFVFLFGGSGSRVPDSGTCSGFRIQGSGFGYNLDGSRRGNNARARLLLPVECLLVVPVHRQPLALLSAFSFLYSNRGFLVSGFWFWFSGFQYSGFGFMIAGFGSQVSRGGIRVPVSRLMV